jgi:hypothetical protein
MGTTRFAREGELDELLDLYRVLNPDDNLPDAGEAADLWGEMLDDDTLDIVVVDHDDRFVATCVLSVTRNLSRGGRPWAVIENVVTHEGYRGRASEARASRRRSSRRASGTATKSCC